MRNMIWANIILTPGLRQLGVGKDVQTLSPKENELLKMLANIKMICYQGKQHLKKSGEAILILTAGAWMFILPNFENI